MQTTLDAMDQSTTYDDGLAQEELEQRVAILRRLKTYLADQRTRLQSYLELLDSQHDAVASGDSKSLEAHLEAEGTLVSQIRQFQRVIDPLQRMYAVSVPDGDKDVGALEESLQSLREQAMERIDRMRDQVKTRMEDLRNEIASLRRPRNPGAYHSDPESSGLLDISA